VAVLAADSAAARAPDLFWCAMVAVWSGAYGVRGILWHQLLDIAADRLSGTRTFVQRRGANFARALVSRVIFPVEIAALAALLWMMPGRASLAALALYGLFAIGKIERFRLRAVLVDPTDRYLLVLVDFYTVFWPISLLIAAALSQPLDIATLALHLLLFSGSTGRALYDGMRLTKRVLD